LAFATLVLLSHFRLDGLFQHRQALVPEGPQEREHLGEPRLVRSIQSARAIAPLVKQAGGLQHGQVLGDGRSGDGEPGGDLAGWQLLAPDQAEDLAAALC
jgi:hypothetical protein